MLSLPSTTPTSPCLHFGDCGGCQAQDVPYEQQLAAKQAMLQELFAAHCRAEIPITPSPQLWHYRNKVDPAFAPMQYPEPPPPGFQRETVLGFKRKGRWFHPLDIEDCLIGPKGLGELLAALRVWARETGNRAWDQRTGEGMLRNVLVRTAARTGERMVVLITRSGPMNLEGFVETVQRVFPCQSIQRGITDRVAEVAIADELEVLDGAPTITARMEIPLGLRGGFPPSPYPSPPEARGEGGTVKTLDFRLSPMSFFQTNTLAAEQLYGMVRAWVGEAPCDTLLDLYGGAGGIAFSCSDLAPRVHSVEEVAAATEDGRHNATINGIGNVEFETADVRAWLKRYLATGAPAENVTVVVDPPRAGLHPKVLKRLLALAPARLVYVSCNPKILARECDALAEGFTLSRLAAVDLFPHTRHVEALALFERKALS